MAINVSTDTTVRITFTVTNDVTGDTLTDAFYFPAGQVPAPGVLRSMALDRYQAWRAVVTAPPRVPTLAEKVDMFRERVRERQRLQLQIDGEDPAVVTAAG